MAIVAILDQRESRSSPDLVKIWQDRLNSSLGDGLLLPFARTTGDEMQALVADPVVLGRLARETVASGDWTLGIGIGKVEVPLPDSVRESRGSAFWAARDAIEAAKTRRRNRPIAVCSPKDVATDAQEGAAFELERCLGALAFIVSRRTARQRELSDHYYSAGYSLEAVISEFSLSTQGARQRLNAAGVQEERELIELATALARSVVEP
jgi:hypothetical protein